MNAGVTILSVPIDDVTMDEALDQIDKFIEEGTYHQVATANVDFVVNALYNPAYLAVLCRCDLVVADGMPLVAASRLLGAPLRQRVAGVDLVAELARRKHRIFLLGSSPAVSEVAAQRLTDLGAQVVGRLTPPVRPLAEFDNDSILSEIERARPDILLVAMGSPKQEMWLDQNRDRLHVPVCIGVGGSLDLIAGAVSRAPLWMQKSGMEWMYRIWAEPRRLALRYAKGAICMGRYLTVQLAVSLATRRAGPALKLGLESIGAVTVLRPTGSMTGARLSEFESMAMTGIAKSGPIVVDLGGVTDLGADGLRSLTKLFRGAANRGDQLWLARATPALARTMRAALCDRLFRTTPSVLEAVRSVSHGRLQLSLELGDGWAACRVAGDMTEGARTTLESIYDLLARSTAVLALESEGEGFNLKESIKQASSKLNLVEEPTLATPSALNQRGV